MYSRSARWVAALAAGAIFMACGAADARALDGTDLRHFEIAVFWGSNRPFLDSTYAHTVEPVLIPGWFKGSGSQSLSLRGRRSSSFGGAAAFFLGRSVGFQILGTAFTTGISGANGPYRIKLRYISLPPPDYQPRWETYERETAWPGTSGELEEKILAVNAVARFHPAPFLTVAVSAGPARFWVDGRAGPLGYTKFTLGGHSVLFPYEYKLAMEFERTAAWGFDAGLEAAFDVLPFLSLALDARVFEAGKTRVPFVFKLDGDPASYFPINLEAEGIPVSPLELDFGQVRLSAGLKFRF